MSGGASAWFFDPQVGVTQPAGLPNSTNIGPSSSPIYSTLLAATPNQLLVGESRRDSTPSGTFRGSAIWAHRPGATASERIGLFDGPFVKSDGQRVARFADVNANGLVVGISEFSVPGRTHATAWLYDSGTGVSRAIGLANPTSNPDTTDVEVFLTESNRAIGYSVRGESRVNWTYNPAMGSTTSLGLFDSAHTLADGGFYGEIEATTEAGFVLGESRRSPSDVRDSFRTSAWVYSPLTDSVTQAGLTINGVNQLSKGLAINDLGQAIGYSYASLPGVDSRAWFFDPAARQTFVLAPPQLQFNRINNSFPRLLNQSGQVVGTSESSTNRNVVWHYDHRTRQYQAGIEFRDAFTPNDAWVNVLSQTESGLVLGRSERSRALTELGHSLWLYDSSTRVKHSLVFSTSSEGHAFTEVAHLTEDGVALGVYDAYTPSDERTRRYFYWSLVHGFHDLQTLVEGELSALGWATLATGSATPFGSPLTLSAFDPTFAWGYGVRADGVVMPFALVEVPEPATLFLALPLVACFRRHDRGLTPAAVNRR